MGQPCLGEAGPWQASGEDLVAEICLPTAVCILYNTLWFLLGLVGAV